MIDIASRECYPYLRRKLSEDSCLIMEASSLDKIVWHALLENRTVDSTSRYVTSSVLSPSPGDTMLCSCSFAMVVKATCKYDCIFLEYDIHT